MKESTECKWLIMLSIINLCCCIGMLLLLLFFLWSFIFRGGFDM